MENPFGTQEKKETFEPTEVKVRDKFSDKNYMLIFDSNNRRTCIIYNQAIHIVLDKHNMRPFHQIGYTDDDPGLHGWEVWVDTTKENMESLIPEVQAEASKIFEEDYNF